MKKVLIALTAVLALVALTPSMASAQASGSVDVDITVNGIVILYYYDNISINIPSSQMAAILGATAAGGFGSGADSSWIAPIDATGGSPTTLTVNNGAPANSATAVSAVALTIQNAWAVRGLAASGVTVDVTVPPGFATTLDASSSGDTIGVSSVGCSGTCTFQPNFATPNVGDIIMNLDFSGVNSIDTYSAGPAFTIQVDFT